MTAIKDIKSYNDNMIKGIEDKLFFLNLLPKSRYIFVDFGCADGTLINTMCNIGSFPNTYIGYDTSDIMINLAKTKWNWSKKDDVCFTSDWKEVESIISDKFSKKVLILSSVIHEVYSYAKSQEDIKDFWKIITSGIFDYIVIRDMLPTEDINRSSDENIYKNVIDKIKIPKERVKEFCDIWGNLTNNKSLIHFLLKYRWQINWDREVKENYFPIYLEELLDAFYNYNLDYLKRFRVPFLDEYFKKEFDITLEDYTHCKLIFSKYKW